MFSFRTRVAGLERIGWGLASAITLGYVLFVALLSYVARHHPQWLTGGGRMTIAMGAALVFIVAVLTLTAAYLHRLRRRDSQPGGPEPRSAPEPGR